MAAAFRQPLIFDLDRGGAGRFQFADSPLDVDRLAESGVGIDDQGNLHAAGHPSRLGGKFREREQPDVGQRKSTRGKRRSRKVNRVVAGLFDEPCAERVERPWDLNRGLGHRLAEQLAR